MKPACEVIVQDVLPGIRAMVALKLIKNFGFSQEQAAGRIGTTQPAISQYKREMRGQKTKLFGQNPKVLSMIDSIAKKAASGELSLDQITLEFCEVCKFLKKEGILCELHREAAPSLENCTICVEKS